MTDSSYLRWKATRRALVLALVGDAAALVRYQLAGNDPDVTHGVPLFTVIVASTLGALAIGLTVDGLRLSPKSRPAAIFAGYVLAMPVMLVAYFLVTPHDLTAIQLVKFIALTSLGGAVAGGAYWDPPNR